MATTPNEARYQVNVDTQQGVKSMEALGKEVEDTNKKFDNIDKTAQGFGGALSVVTNTMGVFGGESAAVAETLTKVQYAMNITAGAKKIAEGSGAMKLLKGATESTSKAMGGLKKALLATGIGAVILAVGALIANFDEVKSYLSDKLPGAGKAMEKVKNVFNGIVSVIKYELLNYLKLIITYFKTIGNVAGDVIGGIVEAVKKAIDGDFGAAKDALTGIFGNVKKDVEEGVDETKDIIHDIVNVSEAYEEGYTKVAREEAAKRAEERKQRAAEAAKQYKQLYDQLVKKYADYGKSQRQILDEQLAQELKLAGKNEELKAKIRAKYNDEIAKLDAEALAAEKDRQQAARDAELQQLEYQLAEQQSTLADSYLSGTMSYEEYITAKERLDNEYNTNLINTLQAQLDAEGLSTEQRLALYNQLANARQHLLEVSNDETATEVKNAKTWKDTLLDTSSQVQSYGDALSGLFGAIASGMDESSDEYKALMITQTIITTLSGIAGAISQGMSMPQPMGAILGAINAATVLATGIANIASMKTANENTDISSASSTISNVTSNLQTPVLTAQSVQGDSQQQTDTRVYVTETDITKSQNNRSRLKTAVTF